MALKVMGASGFLRRGYRRLATNLRDMSTIHSAGKRKLWAQLSDIIRLKIHGNGVKVKEYLGQEMFSDDLYPGASIASFGGIHFKERVHACLNNIRWEGMVTDKLIQYTLLKQYDIPHPPVLAAASSRERNCGDIPVFTDINALAEFLRGDKARYPMYCKPVKGYSARDINKLIGYEAETDSLVLHGGARVSLLGFLGDLKADEWGFLFQEAAKPANDTAPICGDAVSGCRIIMLLDNDSAYPFRATWKVPLADSIVDNYVSGSLGNLMCDIDLGSGLVKRVICGTGSSLKINPLHPDTGYQLLGTTVPQWHEILQMLSRAALCFPGFRWQHWDIGISVAGPVVFELNSAGNVDIMQLSSGKGIDDPQLQEFLGNFAGTEAGYSHLFPR
ncbi:MAG: sugar-transfer associated ATP-grasp domain-containing protein [Pseudomonadota bacterium]